jgi:hypothetical protein
MRSGYRILKGANRGHIRGQNRANRRGAALRARARPRETLIKAVSIMVRSGAVDTRTAASELGVIVPARRGFGNFKRRTFLQQFGTLIMQIVGQQIRKSGQYLRQPTTAPAAVLHS